MTSPPSCSRPHRCSRGEGPDFCGPSVVANHRHSSERGTRRLLRTRPTVATPGGSLTRHPPSIRRTARQGETPGGSRTVRGLVRVVTFTQHRSWSSTASVVTGASLGGLPRRDRGCSCYFGVATVAGATPLFSHWTVGSSQGPWSRLSGVTGKGPVTVPAAQRFGALTWRRRPVTDTGSIRMNHGFRPDCTGSSRANASSSTALTPSSRDA